MENSFIIKLLFGLTGLLMIVLVCILVITKMSDGKQDTTVNKEKSENSLLTSIAREHATSNVIISPKSIESCLTLLYFGSHGTTAAEIQHAIGLDFKKNNSHIPSRISANKIFANSSLEILQKFKDFAKNHFNAEMENVDFAKKNKSLNAINSWLQIKADIENYKKIEILNGQPLDKSTSVVIINAIYFRGKWQVPFNPALTTKGQFWTTEEESTEVDMMHGQHNYLYGNFENLNATGVELNYVDANSSMIVILPNTVGGLKELEANVQHIDLQTLRQSMKLTNIEIYIPKFSTQFSLKLNEHLKKIGIRALFSDSSNLSGMFKTNQSVRVSKVYQKAFIEIHEYGSGNLMDPNKNLKTNAKPKSKQIKSKFIFNVNHPFLFLIRIENATYIIGHIIKL